MTSCYSNFRNLSACRFRQPGNRDTYPQTSDSSSFPPATLASQRVWPQTWQWGTWPCGSLSWRPSEWLSDCRLLFRLPEHEATVTEEGTHHQAWSSGEAPQRVLAGPQLWSCRNEIKSYLGVLLHLRGLEACEQDLRSGLWRKFLRGRVGLLQPAQMTHNIRVREERGQLISHSFSSQKPAALTWPFCWRAGCLSRTSFVFAAVGNSKQTKEKFRCVEIASRMIRNRKRWRRANWWLILV